jgi:hypothetical protein
MGLLQLAQQSFVNSPDLSIDAVRSIFWCGHEEIVS